MKITNPTQQQKDDAEKKAIEEHHAILFILGADKYKYGKLLEEMKNDVVRKKDPFPKTIGEASHLLSKWTNNYSGKYNNGKNDANVGMAFATVMEEKEKEDKNGKKQHITCFRCKKKRNYSNECTEELPATSEKNGTSLLINKDDSSDKDEQYEEEEENNSATSEGYHTENQDKESIALDDDKTSDDNRTMTIAYSKTKITKVLNLYKT